MGYQHSGRWELVKEGHDPFNGVVAIFKDTGAKSERVFWTEQQRKGVITDAQTFDEAEESFQLFVSDAMF